MQCVYADMRGNVLVHAKVPELGLHAIQWAVVSWAASQKRRESVADAKYFYRSAHHSPVLCMLTVPAHQLPALYTVKHPKHEI